MAKVTISKRKFKVLKLLAESYISHGTEEEREQRSLNEEMFHLPLTDAELLGNRDTFAEEIEQFRAKCRQGYKNPEDIINNMSGEYKVIAYLEWKHHFPIEHLYAAEKGKVHLCNQYGREIELTFADDEGQEEGMVYTLIKAPYYAYYVDRHKYKMEIFNACKKANTEYLGAGGFLSSKPELDEREEMLAYMEAMEKSKQETIDLIEELENEKNEDMAEAENNDTICDGCDGRCQAKNVIGCVVEIEIPF